ADWLMVLSAHWQWLRFVAGGRSRPLLLLTVPPGSDWGRNRAGNSCSPARDGKLIQVVRCARRSGLAGRGGRSRMVRWGWGGGGGRRGRGGVPGFVTRRL